MLVYSQSHTRIHVLAKLYMSIHILIYQSTRHIQRYNHVMYIFQIQTHVISCSTLIHSYPPLAYPNVIICIHKENLQQYVVDTTLYVHVRINICISIPMPTHQHPRMYHVTQTSYINRNLHAHLIAKSPLTTSTQCGRRSRAIT